MIKKPSASKYAKLEEILAVLFLLLALCSAIFPFFNLDLQISQLTQSIKTPFFYDLMKLVSTVGNTPWAEIILCTVFLLLYKFKMRTEAYLSLFSSLGSVAFGSLTKMVIDRPRPDIGVVNVLVQLTDKSFPSNHVIYVTSLFGFLLFLSIYVFRNQLTKLIVGSICTFLILLIGVSRIYLGAHWASDVMGGYLLGTLFLIVTVQIYKKATNT